MDRDLFSQIDERPLQRAGGLRSASTVDAEIFGIDELEMQAPAPVEVEEEPAEPTIVQISAKTDRMVFRKENFFIVAARSREHGEFTIKATSGYVPEWGDQVNAVGKWGTYKGRKTFEAVMIRAEVPNEARGLITWFEKGNVDGVGKMTAVRLIEVFGDRAADYLDKPDEMIRAGIPKARADAIAAAWQRQAGDAEIAIYLGKLDFGPSTIQTIIDRYGASVMEVIENDPWSICENVQGVGFKRMDDVALKKGFSRVDPRRVRAGIRHVMSTSIANDGHTGVTKYTLGQKVRRELEIDWDSVNRGIDECLANSTLINDEDSRLLFLPDELETEQDLAKNLSDHAELSTGVFLTEDEATRLVDEESEAMNIVLDDSQRTAAVMALTSPISIITGGPGTGKSTTQKVIVSVLRRLEKRIALAAPTGKAAKRLSEVSLMEASTCHRLLQYEPEEGDFVFGKHRKFEESWLIVDEFSMVDTWLATKFTDAIGFGTGVTIVGDVDQLPSVGSGQVLRDLIEANTIPVAKLNRIHRQKGGSPIVDMAHAINTGESPTRMRFSGSDVTISDLGGMYEMRDAMMKLILEDLPARGFEMADIQVLAAMKRTEVGVEELNQFLKEELNPARPEISVAIGKTTLTVGDRIMQTRNDYERAVFNGESGTIIEVGETEDEDLKGKRQTIPFAIADFSGHKVRYTSENIENLQLAWACTVHKSQGCEYPVVIMMVPWAHKPMLSRNLLYTAVTRAKTECHLIGHNIAIDHAAGTGQIKRFTGLQQRLRRGAGLDPHPIPETPVRKVAPPSVTSGSLMRAPSFGRR